MVTVSISPEQAARLRNAVECGAYASGSEVVRAALRLWVATVEQDDGQARTPQKNQPEEDFLNVAELYAAHAGLSRRA
jgi:antitoxin ParD1/3/4